MYSPNASTWDINAFYISEQDNVGVVVISKVTYDIYIYRPRELPVQKGFYVVVTAERLHCSTTSVSLDDINILKQIDELVINYNGTMRFEDIEVDVFQLGSFDRPAYYYSEVVEGVPVALEKTGRFGAKYFNIFQEFLPILNESVIKPPKECFKEGVEEISVNVKDLLLPI